MLISRTRRQDIILLAIVHLVLFALLFKPWNGEGCDGPHYYSYLSSVLFDGDFDTLNDFALSNNGIYTILEQTGKISPNGFIVNPYAVGNAILWFPFVLPVRVAAWIDGRLHPSPSPWATDRFSPPYCFAVSIAGFWYGYAALLLIYLTCRMLFRRVASCAGALGVMYASPALFYTYYSPDMAHVESAFCMALLVYLSYRHRKFRGPESYLLISMAAALTALVRWQDNVFLLIPFAFWIRHMRRTTAATWVRSELRPFALAMVVFVAIVAVQLCTWRVIFGQFLTMPQGSDYMKWTRPAIVWVLFSGWHGLFYYHPLLLLGAIGILVAPFCTRGALPAVAMAACALIVTYVNSCCFDWYGNASFGSRRFCSLLPCFAIGMAGVYTYVRRWWRAAPLVLTVIAVLANIMLVTAYSRRVFDVYFLSELWGLRGELPRLLAHWIPTIPLESQPLVQIIYKGRIAWPVVEITTGCLFVIGTAVLACRGWFRRVEKHAVAIACLVALLFTVMNAWLLFACPRHNALGQQFAATVNGNLPDDQKKKEINRILDAGYLNPAAVVYCEKTLKDTSRMQRDLDIMAAIGPSVCAKWAKLLPAGLLDASQTEDRRCRPRRNWEQLYVPGYYGAKASECHSKGDVERETSWYLASWHYNPFDTGVLRRLAEIAEETHDRELVYEYRMLRLRILRVKAESYLSNVRHIRYRDKEIQRDYRLRLFQPWYQEGFHELVEAYMKEGDYRKVVKLCKKVEQFAMLPMATRELRTKAEAALGEKQ